MSIYLTRTFLRATALTVVTIAAVGCVTPENEAKLHRQTQVSADTLRPPAAVTVSPTLPQEAANYSSSASAGATEVAEEAESPPEVEVAANAAEPDATVLALQRLLNSYGWRLAEDGRLGPRTRQALFEFQETNGLERNEAPGETLAWAEGREDIQGRSEQTSQQPQAIFSGGGRVARLEQWADATGFDWRSRGVTFHVGCSPIALRDYGRCTWALYEIEPRRIFVAERITQGSAREHYLVLHELAHAWQFTVRNWPQAASDVSDWGKHGMEGLEAAADCLALAWGAPTHHYWNCPADAQAHMLALYHSITE